jgi:hypothetical protein
MPDPEPSLPAIPTPTALTTYPLPLDRFRPTDDENVLIRRAYGLLIRDCMHRIGFPDYTPPIVASQPRADGADEFGYLNRDVAAAVGFHDPRSLAGKTGHVPGRRDSSAEIAALSGAPAPGSPATPSGRVPPGGCTAEADRDFRRDLKPIDSAVVTKLAMAAHDATVADSRVVAATRQWSACMWRAGYAYRTPADPITEVWAAKPTASEVAIALADVACTRRTNLAGIAMAVMTADEQRLVDMNRPALDAVRAVVDHWVQKARQIVESDGA